MDTGVLLQGSARADHREMAIKAAKALTSVGSVRDTTFFSDVSIAIRFEMGAERVGELHERLVAAGIQLDEASERILRQGASPESAASARGRQVAGTLQIRFLRDAQYVAAVQS